MPKKPPFRLEPDPDLTGAETLVEAFELITGPRQAAYSHPEKDYGQVVRIFEAMTGVQLTAQQGVLFMVAVKLARLTHNLDEGRFHRDSLVDAAGYLGCLAMIENRREARRGLDLGGGDHA